MLSALCNLLLEEEVCTKVESYSKRQEIKKEIKTEADSFTFPILVLKIVEKSKPCYVTELMRAERQTAT